MCRPARFFLVGFLTIAGLAVAGAAYSHGIGVPQVVNVRSGPYLLSVWTDPDPLREDEAHVVVAVMDPETRAPLIEGYSVAVRLDSLSSAESLTATALPDNSANQLLYVVEFNDQISAGSWQATVMVDGPEGQANDVTFPLTITNARGFNWLWLGVAGLAVAVGGWLLFSMRSRAPHPRESAQREALK